MQLICPVVNGWLGIDSHFLYLVVISVIYDVRVVRGRKSQSKQIIS